MAVGFEGKGQTLTWNDPIQKLSLIMVKGLGNDLIMML